MVAMIFVRRATRVTVSGSIGGVFQASNEMETVLEERFDWPGIQVQLLVLVGKPHTYGVEHRRPFRSAQIVAVATDPELAVTHPIHRRERDAMPPPLGKVILEHDALSGHAARFSKHSLRIARVMQDIDDGGPFERVIAEWQVASVVAGHLDRACVTFKGVDASDLASRCSKVGADLATPAADVQDRHPKRNLRCQRSRQPSASAIKDQGSMDASVNAVGNTRATAHGHGS